MNRDPLYYCIFYLPSVWCAFARCPAASAPSRDSSPASTVPAIMLANSSTPPVPLTPSIFRFSCAVSSLVPQIVIDKYNAK